MNIPRLVPGPGKDMLAQAIRHLVTMPLDAATRADAFEAMAGQIEREATTPWLAVRLAGSDGSHIFLGRTVGNSPVVSPDGRIYSGGQGAVRIVRGAAVPDYAALRPIA